MSNRNRQDRAVRPSDLERPEAAPLQGREPADTPEPPATAEDQEENPPSRADLLAQAKVLQPAAVHWLSEWEAGRDAAVAASLKEKDAAALAPPHDVGCMDCWIKGRDAVVALIAG